jgi:hypothetical protein
MIDFEIEIYCSVDAVPKVIRAAAVGSIAQRTVQVKLPTGHIMDVPTTTSPQDWAQNGVAEPVPLQGHPPTVLLDLRFPADEELRAFCKVDPRGQTFWMNGREYALLKYITLRVRAGERYAAVRFWAAGKKMSIVFLQSRAIHHYFLQALWKADGLAGIIHDMDEFDLYLLDDPHRKIAISWQWSYHHGHSSGQELDRFVKELLHQIEVGS